MPFTPSSLLKSFCITCYSRQSSPQYIQSGPLEETIPIEKLSIKNPKGLKPPSRPSNGIIVAADWGAQSPVNGSEIRLNWESWDISQDKFVERHNFLRELNSGAQGSISLWSNKDTGTVFAAKKMVSKKRTLNDSDVYVEKRRKKKKTSSGADFVDTMSEIIERLPEADRGLSILTIFAFETLVDGIHSRTTRTIMEFCNGGDLWDYGSRCTMSGTKVPELFIWYIFVQMAEALAFLHKGMFRKDQYLDQEWTPIIHRDIKPENIFLARDSRDPNGFPICRLGDFDLAMFYYEDGSINGTSGTYCWQPPEQWAHLSHPRATPAGDIWALGAVIQWLATTVISGEVKCCNTDKHLRKSLERTSPRRKMSIYPRYSRSLQFCMDAAMRTDPKNRADAEVLCQMLRLWFPMVDWYNRPESLQLNASKTTKRSEAMFQYLQFESWETEVRGSPEIRD